MNLNLLNLRKYGPLIAWALNIQFFPIIFFILSQLADFNFGTLLRLDPTKGYSEDNTTIVPRIQFLSIEAARMREKKNIDFMAPFDRIFNCFL